MVASITQVSRDIDALPSGVTMTKEQLIDCLGIEAFLTEGAARRSAEVRRAHVAAILSEQRIQKQTGAFNVETLSMISQVGSYGTKSRAEKLARCYAALLVE